MKAFLLALLLILLSGLSEAQTTIYLVRHAEKISTKDVKDPDLTQIGQFRALNIAKQLSKVGITDVYSTNYKRTMQTAKPLADHLKVAIKHYDPSKLKEFSQQIKSIQGNILIVGHSNTTPQLTSLISGKEVAPLSEHDFDNLYQVILLEDKTMLNHFKSIPSYELNTKINTQPMKVIVNENK